jgi:aspartate aminotransferase
MEARRVSEISTSQIRKMFEIVERARRSGREVISLTIGEPDFHTHPEILKRAYEAMKAGYTHYTSNFGIDELREQIAEIHDVSVEEVMVTAGASEALLNASLAYIERGSEVLIPLPSFISYFTYAKLCEARVLGINTAPNFELNPDELNEMMSRDVSVVFINSPSNPTGVVLDQKTLDAVCEIARDNNAIVVSDEVYISIHYDKKPGTLAGREGVIAINAFSKSLAMTGWRIGYVIAEQSLLDSILKIHQVNGVCAPAFAQKAVAEVLAEGIAKDITDGMVREFRKRRDYVYKSLKSILEVVKPEGAFYIFPRANHESVEFTEKLLSETGVAVTPGIAFGSENHIRISYAASMENLERAMGRIKLFVESLG